MADPERDSPARSRLFGRLRSRSHLRSPALALALASMLLLAGCAGPFAGGDGQGQGQGTDGPSPTASPGATANGTGSPTATPDESNGDTAPTATPATDAPPSTESPANRGTSGPTSAPDVRSPWGDDPVVVAVEGPAGRNFVPQVRAATGYWERNDERYAGYPVSFRVRPDAANPDIVVRFVENVPECGGADDAAGCAPHVTAPEDVRGTVPVYVRTGLSDRSTRRVLKHEFGHVLGLNHGDAPKELMRPRSTLYTTPRPNVTERAFPWNDSTFTVYVDERGVERPAAVRSQIDHALEYYEDGAPGMPNNLTFRYVDDPADADVVIRFRDSAACQRGSGSCAETRGHDPDGDGAIETYNRLTITLVDLDTDAVGWHVGNWLAYALGAEAERERPPPFRDASYEERRSEWWH